MVDSDKIIYEKLEKEKQLVIGQNTVLRAIQKKELLYVVVALDAQNALIQDIIRHCKNNNIEVFVVHSGMHLGQCVGVDVRTMVVGVKI